ncbi:DUF5808 domain-containing protein [Cellulomonas fimi]|uniref:DUF5808 domain-containing protein n=1 Tax=Cellulomonas fimi (strain ATCC 484 / DSM 20113 / JCM 1341 / CCUG 24087 / LMG 16345 / NBRC 15513 / NCIMB 8980 / NCTC 7547 / NRS-133) TaxID=590998 RepID=F4H4P0_CELFA|nr:DUF5808 domain-containing protein [Cellulomonas fimi]AEE44241.1 hypothetical protein Celf_0091 [Cellulomonas fimi ATCC 484]VEH25952.1 Uncharacterised protein [Cellulomonas fimi]
MSHEREGRRRPDLPSIVRVVTIALAVTALVKELRTPADERQWHGKVVGFVPYEFRLPTFERVRARLWDPEAEHVLGPKVFGVGWTVNVGRVVALGRERVASGD